MKTILGLMVSAMLVMGLVGAGTFAFFSDTETSTGNVLSAGTLDLTVGGATSMPFSVGPLVPGDTSDPEVNVTLINVGTLDGTIGVTFGAIVNDDGILVNAETDAALGNDLNTSSTTGELGGLLEIAVWLDENNDGWDDSLDIYLTNVGGSVNWTSGSVVPPGAYQTLDSFSGDSWTSLATLANTNGETYFKISYRWVDGGVTDNIAQGDSSTFDITFNLTQ